MELMDWRMLEFNTVLGIYGGLCGTTSPSAYLFSLSMKIPSRLFFLLREGFATDYIPRHCDDVGSRSRIWTLLCQGNPGQSPPAWQLKILFSLTKGKLTQPRPNHQVEVQKTTLVFPSFEVLGQATGGATKEISFIFRPSTRH